MLIEQVAARPLTAAPPAVLDALERADAGILCVQPQQGELGARMAIVAVVERRADPLRAHGRRHAADHAAGHARRLPAGRRAEHRGCASGCRTRTSLRVETPAGTTLTATFDPALHWVKTSGLISTRYWSNLPAGEVFTTPASVDGVFVCNGTAGDYFGPKYGDLARDAADAGDRRRPAASARTATARSSSSEFWDYCHTDEYSDRVGELAFGTNIALEDMIGVLLQDEKIPGVHLAFGDPYGSQTGAPTGNRARTSTS